MLDAYRTWLERELKTLGNASHHAYSFGQANMAKRALEQLDQALATSVVLEALAPPAAGEALAALDALPDAPAALTPLRDALRRALHPEA
ncbi:MAG TPA: hypothetical protein VNJ51_11995 [Candidatus Dormibacteraeota bacterium]|nr:hypothetical protein [Candidatus Dormibacteraeota bacterium]